MAQGGLSLLLLQISHSNLVTLGIPLQGAANLGGAATSWGGGCAAHGPEKAGKASMFNICCVFCVILMEDIIK